MVKALAANGIAGWSLNLLLLSIAVLAWPQRVGPLFGSLGPGAPRRARRTNAPTSMVLVAAAGFGIGLIAGVLPGIAATVAAATAARLVSAARARRSAQRELEELLAALRMLVRELRAGAAAPAAAAAVAEAVGGSPGSMLADLAAAARMGIEHPPEPDPGLTGAIGRRLRSGLALSLRHGVPWAALVETICTELADRVRTEGIRAAQIAGPRFSGYVLAALPLFGILLGSGLGASPLAILFGPAPGGLLLPAGTILLCLGLIWSARIVR